MHVVLSQRMQDLFSVFQSIAGSTGFTVELLSGERTCEKQLQLSRNRCSHHLSRNAIDVKLLPTAPLAAVPGYERSVLSQLVNYARGTGFRWGGDFREPDPNHFDDGLRVGRPRCCADDGSARVAAGVEREG